MRKFTFVLILLFFLLVPSGVAFAGSMTDRVVRDDDIIPNDVTIFDDDLEIQAGGRVNGDVVVWNGNAVVAGTVRGDLVVINGDVDVTETAVIHGQCVLVNGVLNGDETSDVHCTTITGLPEIPGLDQVLNEIPNFSAPLGSYETPLDSFWGNLADAVGRTLFFGFLAFVAASFLPQHIARIGETVRRRPMASGSVGVLTAVAVPILVTFLGLFSALLLIVCVGILGFPIVIGMSVALLAGAFLGWITMGNLVGTWAVDKMNLQNRSLPVTAVIGTMLLTFFFGLLGAIPWIMGEWLVGVFAMCMGLGAVALTKFGTQTYPPVMVGEPNVEKITAVLDTLPDEELAD
jgi:hypothetical protein